MEGSPDVGNERAGDAGHVLVALTQERVSSLARFGVGAQGAVKAELLTSGANDDAEHRGQREHEQHAITAPGGAERHMIECQAEAPVLLVAERVLDVEAASVELNDVLGSRLSEIPSTIA